MTSKLNYTYVVSGKTGGFAHLEPEKINNGMRGACGRRLVRYRLTNTLPVGFAECPVCTRVTESRYLPTQEKVRGGRKLYSDEVKQIRALYATGAFSRVDLAARYRVSTVTIWSILSGKTWSNL